MSNIKEGKPVRVNVPLSLPEELDQQVETAAEKLHMSKQDTMRQALIQGLPKLLEILTPASEGRAA